LIFKTCYASPHYSPKKNMQSAIFFRVIIVEFVLPDSIRERLAFSESHTGPGIVCRFSLASVTANFGNMRIQREHDAIRLWMYFLLAEPPKSGYSDDQYEEVLLREDNKKRHAFKKSLMFDAFIKDIQRNWQNFFEPCGDPQKITAWGQGRFDHPWPHIKCPEREHR
jgi:hypothetical protein